MSETAAPSGARDHARAMGSQRVRAMPIVPATASTAPPAGVSPAQMLWDETIAAGGYAAKQLNRGARLQLMDLDGDACASLLIFNAERPVERLNVADTIKVQWNAYLGAGGMLLSDMGRVLMSVLAEDGVIFDVFCGASNAQGNARKYGGGENHGPHPNARDRFLIALGKYGLGRKDIHPCISFFKPVRVGEDGGVTVDAGPFPAGRTVTLRADMDVIVVVANCPHPLDPRAAYSVTPLRTAAWRGEIAGVEDAIRRAAPEAERAFANVDDYYLR
ncbi:MAG: urea amidolyase associated protein UAAP1 [Hyphomonadaceae bacterium]